jgi:hypothetical protein
LPSWALQELANQASYPTSLPSHSTLAILSCQVCDLQSSSNNFRVSTRRPRTNKKAETGQVEVHQCPHRGKKIYLVDTPGFDDTHRSDTDVLREIAAWLEKAYSHQVHLTGIIYLHRITDRRVGGSAIKNLRMFQQLCGDDGLPAVVFATTMWDALREGDETGALARENELISRPEFWGLMLQKGSRVFRQDKGFESATQIVDYLISRQSTILLDIQCEMAESSLSLDQTTAGQEVSNDVNSRKAKLENDIREQENAIQEELRQLVNDIREQENAMQEEVLRKIRLEKEQARKMRMQKEAGELQHRGCLVM